VDQYREEPDSRGDNSATRKKEMKTGKKNGNSIGIRSLI